MSLKEIPCGKILSAIVAGSDMRADNIEKAKSQPSDGQLGTSQFEYEGCSPGHIHRFL